MISLYDLVTDLFVYECRKHDLHPIEHQYAANRLNELSNAELLKLISDKLGEIFVDPN